MSDVTQADREAADALVIELLEGASNYELAQAFARHRLQARADALEEAAKVADEHARRAWEVGEAAGQNAICSSGRNHGARFVAIAIRNLTSTEEGDKT